MLKKITYLLICFSISLSAQTNEKIKEKNEELSDLKTEITKLEKELNTKSAKEKESIQSLENLNQQSLLLNKLINRLLREEKSKENQINKLSSEIENLENKIEKLQEKYSMYIVWLYKHGGESSTLENILTAKSLNQAMIRFKYLRSITRENEKTLSNLKEDKQKLRSLQVSLRTQVRQKKELVEQKRDEQEFLTQRQQEKNRIITVLKKDQEAIKNEIEDKRRAEIEIKNLITKLIEEERERLASLRRARMENKSYKLDYNYDDFENFAELKGKLSWPVREGRITRNFGENKNKRLNTVTLNYGIDINLNKEENVYAVAEGIISAINWIPGYGSVIIVTHKNNFRTVYGHVADITVNEGDKVLGGTPLGKVNESLEGIILHFEIWNERNYQNPTTWLARK
jgi:septal ring factor EnvC (AmiA/AmiB activator)